MKKQLRTVNETAKLTGITIRALHYYDEIGLLKPSEISEAGYRFYSNEDIVLLQQILFLKEIGFELKQIKEIINNPNFDEKVALKQHKEILILKKNRIENLIKLVDDKLEGDDNLSFSEFDETDIIAKQEEYRKEVIERFGHTEAYKEYEQRKSKDKGNNYIDKKAEDIFRKIAGHMDCPPSCDEVQKLILQWKNHITENYYTCTDEILQCLGLMYVEDERFKKYFDNISDNLAEYVSEAIKIYCDKG